MKSPSAASSLTEFFRLSSAPSLSTDDLAAVGGGVAAANFNHYAAHSSRDTELFWVRVEVDGQLIAATPVVRLRKRKATDMLRRGLRRWIGPVLGPLARKTTLLVDAAFMAYDAGSPFLCAPGADRDAVKLAVASSLKSQPKVDAVWISEPPAESVWAAALGFQQFHTLPMVHVDLAGCDSFAGYVAGLSKKRRRNLRHEQQAFAAAGAAIEVHRGPPEGELLEACLSCLAASAVHSQFTVPYNDVLTDPQAFRTQQQTILAARVGKEVVGFMSFLEDGERLLQCHGGLDYRRSHEVAAYHNLIYAGIDYAVSNGFRVMSMGPLNNETKRRAGGVLRPIVASLWNRNPVDAFVAKALFVKNFEVYRGELGAGPTDGPEATESTHAE